MADFRSAITKLAGDREKPRASVVREGKSAIGRANPAAALRHCHAKTLTTSATRLAARATRENGAQRV